MTKPELEELLGDLLAVHVMQKGELTIPESDAFIDGALAMAEVLIIQIRNN